MLVNTFKTASKLSGANLEPSSRMSPTRNLARPVARLKSFAFFLATLTRCGERSMPVTSKPSLARGIATLPMPQGASRILQFSSPS
jgi:hypothetical protein